MRPLPLLLSVPHAGLEVPPEALPYCILAQADIAADGDEGAAAIYALAERVTAFETASVARAIVDLNRSEDDRRADGVVKTHTCWEVPVYRPFPPAEVVERLLARYHRPYHAALTAAASRRDVRLGIDCHTMAGEGPPVGPDPGQVRPAVCLSDAEGTCPRAWIEELARCFRRALGDAVGTGSNGGETGAGDVTVAINRPFAGGHIIRSHAAELPWIQVELSRSPFLSDEGKRSVVLTALTELCGRLFSPPGRSG